MEHQTTVPYGYCHCGCGEKTSIMKGTDRSKGYEKGQPRRFILQHQARLQFREKNPFWKGGKSTNHGYILIRQSNHPRAIKKGYVFEHILVAERALGKFLPPGAEVHHWNEVKNDNRGENLAICEDQAYHKLLHVRMRAWKACGNPNYRKCVVCKQYDDPSQIYFPPHQTGGYHRSKSVPCTRNF